MFVVTAADVAVVAFAVAVTSFWMLLLPVPEFRRELDTGSNAIMFTNPKSDLF